MNVEKTGNIDLAKWHSKLWDGRCDINGIKILDNEIYLHSHMLRNL